MKRYTGQQTVEPGIYLNVRQLRFHNAEDRGALPGTPGDVWRRVPAPVLLVVGPLVGLVYVMFLPLLGFVGLLWAAGAGARKAARKVAEAREARRAWQARKAEKAAHLGNPPAAKRGKRDAA